jgi:hypothetical protein
VFRVDAAQGVIDGGARTCKAEIQRSGHPALELVWRQSMSEAGVPGREYKAIDSCFIWWAKLSGQRWAKLDGQTHFLRGQSSVGTLGAFPDSAIAGIVAVSIGRDAAGGTWSLTWAQRGWCCPWSTKFLRRSRRYRPHCPRCRAVAWCSFRVGLFWLDQPYRCSETLAILILSSPTRTVL